MSTILDALRKSERTRRAGQVPMYGNASEPPAPTLLRRSTALAGIALLVAVIVFAWLLQRRPPEIVTETVPAVTPEPVVQAIPTPVPIEPAPAAPLTKSETQTSAPREQPVAAPKPAPVKRPPATATTATGELPIWSSLPESARAGLPPLRVNIHVYTPDESQRILYIDNEPRVRGEEVAPGVFVEDIVPEGAIVRYRGQRYLLPRPT